MKIKIAALLLIAASCWAFTAAAANPIAARQAFRAELEKNPQAFRKYLNDKDPEIRRYAIYLLAEKDGVKAIPVLGKALEDSDPQVQYTATEALAGDEALFVKVVKASFGQRRKMIRNSLRSVFGDFGGAEHRFFTQRAEQLSVADFVELTNWVSENK